MPFRKRLIPYNKGKKKNEAQKAQIFTKICPFCKKEIKTKRKNQIYCNLICYSKSDKLKEFAKNSSLINKNSLNKYHLGHKHSEVTKNKILVHPNRHSFPKGKLNPGYLKSEATIQKIKDKRLFQKVLKKDTRPEVAMQNLLTDLQINFTKHKPLLNIEHKYQCDLFIEPNIIIECDGDYFHNYPYGRELDRVRTKELSDKGYKVIRFWEHEIKKDIDFCKKKILEVINEKR